MIGTRLRMVLVTASFGVAVLVLSACNTVEGIGKDVRKGGEKLESVAKDVKQML